MKCREFAQIVVELARGQMMDAAQRAQGLAHAESCARCAARLEDERALTVGLRAVAARDAELSSSASTEAMLLMAFRQKATAPVVAPQWAAINRWPRWAWAAAAAIVLALSVVALRAMQASTSDEALVALPVPKPIIIPNILQNVAVDRSEMRRDAPVPRATRGAQPVNHRRLINQNKQRPQPVLIRDGMTLYASDSEVLSDFFPLTHEASLPPLESGQLIRVQLPRSALVAYGLPVNLARADTPLKADLLVGEDGQARAIRFVR